MKRKCKNLLAVLLVLAMAVSGMTLTPKTSIQAASADAAPMTTEDIDDPVEETENAQVYFVSSATGKLITLDGVENNPIDCNTVYNSESTVPANGLFTIYYGFWSEREVVNFTNTATETSWKANNDNIFQMGKRTDPAGWESVKMTAMGDGTVSFQSNANGKYFTVEGEILKLIELKDQEKPSANEKFTAYTKTKPKTAKKVTLSEIDDDSITVSWEGVSECIYSGYEVLYSTQENGTYQSAGKTADTTFTVEGLDINTTYYFKVRTLVNNTQDAVYSESKIAYGNTLAEFKPRKVNDIEVTEQDNGLAVNWTQASYATSYKVYRAESRFAEYREIGETADHTFVDTNPNTSSKFHNYYKVEAVNGSAASELSEPASLEISMFGSNMYVFNETDDVEQINSTVNSIFEGQHYDQFGDNRYVLAYKPGDYTDTADVNMGYYTQTIGLGKTPYDVRLRNVRIPAALSENNATCNFWVGIENVSIADLDNNDDPYFNFQWSASQAAPARRLYVERKAVFDWYYGWASGGFIADSIFQKAAGSFSQQQYYYRNCVINGGVYGVNWNNFIQGCEGLNDGNSSDGSDQPIFASTPLGSGNGLTNWNQRGKTTVIEKTPEIREKPFLYFDTQADGYKVFIPALRKNTSGVSCSEDNMGQGTSISVDKYFYIARSDRDTADTINEQLKLGKNIIFAPGIYHVDKPIEVTKADTVLLGLGQATIVPDNEEAAIVTEDVGGLAICGLILDAGNYSKTLLTVGKEGCNKDHSENPTVLQDVIYRVGGTGNLGRCESCQVINSNNVIIDHTWVWRADHGNNTGWTKNTSDNGLIVNGDDVTAYGLFVEHFQKYDILWRGERGRTYFLQNEKCYDPQSQEGWMSHDGTVNGYAAYKVSNDVKEHYAVGLGIYDVFINTNGASIFLDNAIEVPDTEGVLIENACIVEIADGNGPNVGINHIINATAAGITTGAETEGGYAIQRLLSYQNKKSVSLPDYYEDQGDFTPQEQTGKTPSNDAEAEKEIEKEEQTKDDEKNLWDMTEEDFDQKQEEAKKQEEEEKNPTTPEQPETQTPDTTEEPNTSEEPQTPATTEEPNTSEESQTPDTTEEPNTSEESQTPVTTEEPNTSEESQTPVTTENPGTSEEPQVPETTGVTQTPNAQTSNNSGQNENTGNGRTGNAAASDVKPGKKFTVGKYTYQISAIRGKAGTVTLVSVAGKYRKKLKKATVSAAVKYSGCQFKITKIGKKAFKKCKKLKTVTLGKNVTQIASKAFYDCGRLKKIVIKGRKFKKIAKNAFRKKVRETITVKAKKKILKIVLKSLKRKK